MDQGKEFERDNTESLGPSQQNSSSEIRKGRGVAVLERLSKNNDGEKSELVYNSYRQDRKSTRLNSSH